VDGQPRLAGVLCETDAVVGRMRHGSSCQAAHPKTVGQLTARICAQ
jgi:hypothetical protein